MAESGRTGMGIVVISDRLPGGSKHGRRAREREGPGQAARLGARRVSSRAPALRGYLRFLLIFPMLSCIVKGVKESFHLSNMDK